MNLFDAIDASNAHSAIGNGSVWKADGENYRVIDLESNDRALLLKRDAEEIAQGYDERGLSFRPLQA
jgi:hypothetical protein